MRARLQGVVLVCLLVATPLVRAGDGATSLPQLAWDKPVWCVKDADNKVYRVQCEPDLDQPSRCFKAPAEQDSGVKLQRVQACTWSFQSHYDYLQSSGVPMEPAIAESPPGWHRDEKGRVFQVTFDLLKRFYLGAAWMPAFGLDEPDASLERGRFEMGFEASWLDPEDRNRHTIRALEGFVTIEQLEVAGSLFTYDLSHASRHPLLRITTFFGPPARHDLYMDLGWGMRLLDIHLHPHQADSVDLEIIELHSGWDIWQSADLYNHLRLETGVAVEGLWGLGAEELSRYALTPNARLEARVGVDPKGFHYLLGDAHWAMPLTISETDRGALHSRAGVRAAYEVIFLAINDQPLSLRLEAALDYRDDLPGEVDKLEASAMAGLRFSFWVPARIIDALPLVARR